MSDTENKVPQEKTLIDYLNELPVHPTQAEIDGWKKQYGDIYVSGLDETEMFIFRPITRKEYLDIQKAPRDQVLTDFDVQELIVQKCLLFASNQDALRLKAGTFQTLTEQVMDRSNFRDAFTARASVMKL